MDKPNMVYTYNRISFYLKKDEIQIYSETQMNLENGVLRMLREMNQTEKDKYCVVPLVWGT